MNLCFAKFTFCPLISQLFSPFLYYETLVVIFYHTNYKLYCAFSKCRKLLIRDAKSTFLSQIPNSLKDELVKHLRSFSNEKRECPGPWVTPLLWGSSKTYNFIIFQWILVIIQNFLFALPLFYFLLLMILQLPEMCCRQSLE